VAVTRVGQAIASGEPVWSFPVAQLMKSDLRATQTPPVQVNIDRQDLLDVLLRALPAGSVFAGHALTGLRVKPIDPKERQRRAAEREERRRERELRHAKRKKEQFDREVQSGTQFRSYGTDFDPKMEEPEEENVEAEIELSFANGHTEDAHFVVAADGRLSTVRGLLFNRPDLRYSGDVCVAANVRLPAAERRDFLPYSSSDFFDVWGRGTRFCYAELNAEAVHWACYLDRKKWYPSAPSEDAGPSYSATAQCRSFSLQPLLSAFSNYPDFVTQLIGRTSTDDVSLWPVCDLKVISNWSQLDGRVVLLGEALHPVMPSFGQNTALCVESAAVLAKCLDEARARTREENLDENAMAKIASTLFKQMHSKRLTEIGEVCFFNNEFAREDSFLKVTLRNMSSRWVGDMVVRDQLRRMFCPALFDSFAVPEFAPRTPLP